MIIVRAHLLYSKHLERFLFFLQLTAQTARVEAQIAAESKKKGGFPAGFEKLIAQMVGDD